MCLFNCRFCNCNKKINLNILERKITDYELSYKDLIKIQSILEKNKFKLKGTKSNYF